MANHGRAQKARGYRAEKAVEALLAPFGFRRMPISGAAGGFFAGDLRRDPGKALVVAEVKRRQGCDLTLRKQLAQGGAHFLVRVPGHGDEPLVVVTMATFRRLLEEAGYGVVVLEAPGPSDG